MSIVAVFHIQANVDDEVIGQIDITEDGTPVVKHLFAELGEAEGIAEAYECVSFEVA